MILAAHPWWQYAIAVPVALGIMAFLAVALVIAVASRWL